MSEEKRGPFSVHGKIIKDPHDWVLAVCASDYDGLYFYDDPEKNTVILTELVNFYVEMLDAGVKDWKMFPFDLGGETSGTFRAAVHDKDTVRAFNRMRDRIVEQNGEEPNPAPKTVKITIDGKETTISLESARNLKKTLSELEV